MKIGNLVDPEGRYGPRLVKRLTRKRLCSFYRDGDYRDCAGALYEKELSNGANTKETRRVSIFNANVKHIKCHWEDLADDGYPASYDLLPIEEFR